MKELHVKRGPCAAAAIVALAMATSPSTVTAQGVGYTLAPTANRVQWADAIGLEDSNLFGGLLSLDFDRFASLQGYYLTNSGMQTSLGRLGLSGPIGGQLRDQELGVRSYGANLLLNLWGSGAVSPFAKVGGGILELRPDVGGRSKQVALNLGGGLRIGANGPVFLDLFAEDMIFRLDRYALFAPTGGGGAVIPADPDVDKLRHNLVMGAAIGVPLGPARTSVDEGGAGPFQWGVAGASLAFEPMAGRLVFDDDAAIGDQDLAGIRAGFDLGRLVGLRGYYWRGTENDFKRTSPVQSWGAEAQFRLNSGPGLTPYALIGGAQLDFRDGFRDTNGATPADRTALVLGGGITLPLSERFGINLTARDYLFSTSKEIGDVASPSDLTSNWMFSAGIRMSVGGRAGTSLAADARDRERRQAARLDSLRDRSAARLDSLRTRDEMIDSLQGVNRRLAMERDARRSERDDVERWAREDSAWVDQFDEAVRGDSLMARRQRRAAESRATLRELAARRPRGDTAFAGEVELAPERTDYSTDRTLSLPAPALGELYVRYGPPGERPDAAGRVFVPRGGGRDTERDTSVRTSDADLTPDELRRMIRETMREEMRTMMVSPASPATSPDEPSRRDLQSWRDYQAWRDRTERDRADGARVREPLPNAPASRDSMRRIPLRKEARTPSSPAQPQADSRSRMTEMSSEDLATVLANRLDATLDERLDQRLDRMDDRLARMQDSLRLAMREEVRRTMEDERRANPAPANVVVPTPTEVEPERRPNRVDPVTGPRLTTYSGFTVNEAGQVLLGARFDAGPLSWQSPGLRFVPELALGFGSGGQSTMLVANGLYRFAGLQLGTLPTLTPHVLAGLGLLNFSDRVGTRDGLEATVNLGYGVSFPLGTWTFAGQRPLLQVEHQGVEFFDLNRLLIGLRWGGR